MFNKSIFKKQLFEFLTEAITICEKNSDKLLIDDIKWPQFFQNGKYKRYTIKKTPDYDFFISHTIKNEIIQLQSYTILTKFFVTKEIQEYNKKLFGNIYQNLEPKPNFANELPLRFLIVYLESHNAFSKNKKLFEKISNSFLVFIENILEDEYTTPLFNFESDINEKGRMISSDVGIRKISDLEFYRFTNLDDSYNNLPTVFEEVTHVMFAKHSSSDLNSGYDVIKNKFQTVLDSLSLYANGSPQFGTIFRNINNVWVHHDSNYEKECLKQKSIFVTKNDLKKIKSILLFLTAVDFSKKENKFLEISIKRFSSALTRMDAVDQLIDLMISIESLYVSSPGEITVRLSNRLSTLLAKNDQQREDYWSFSKKVYNLRSGIVHGDGLRSTEINGQDYSLEKIIEKLFELARESIKIYLKIVNQYSGKNKIDKICEDIDRGLINKTYLRQLHAKFQ